MTHLRDRFAALIAPGSRADLGRAALEIARIAYPELDPGPHLTRLDELACAVRPRLRPAMTAEEAAGVLAAYLFDEHGFRGNSEDYYDPRNSFLNDVLERRLGIPISLSIVFMEIARRVGLGVEGVGFPGHFLVRVTGRRGQTLLDPFFGGRQLGEADLLERLRDVPGRGGSRPKRVPAGLLAPTDTPGILARMLRNLLRIYADTDGQAEALAAVDLLLVLEPDSIEHVRVRGLLYERLECFSAAAADFRHYLDRAPDANDAEQVRTRLLRAQRAARRLH